MAQTKELKREYPDFKQRYGTFFEDYSKDFPVQQARQAWQDTLNVLSDIGQIALPPLLGSLKQFDSWLKTIYQTFEKIGVKPSDSAIKYGANTGAGTIAGIWPGALPGSVGLATGGIYGAAIGAGIADTASHPNSASGAGFLGAIENALRAGWSLLGKASAHEIRSWLAKVSKKAQSKASSRASAACCRRWDSIVLVV